MDKKRLCRLIDEGREELFELLCKLIRIDSQSFNSWGKERELAEYVHAMAKEMGLESDLYSPLELEGFTEDGDYFPGRGLEDRLNVTLRLRGESEEPGLMLMAHTDTVEVGDLANWTVDPFGGVIKDGRIYGRGATDDKYAIAVGLYIMKLFKQEGYVPKRSLLLSAYSDEEYGGSHGALASVLRYPCENIVSMDGHEGEIWNAASGGGEIKYFFHVRDVVNSAERAGRALTVVMDCLESFAENRRLELEANPYYKGTEVPDSSMRYMGLRAADRGTDLGVGEAYFVFYTDKEREEIWQELRELEKVIAQRLEPLGIQGDGFRAHTRFFHYSACPAETDGIQRLIKAARDAEATVPAVIGSCLSDLSIIAKRGSATAFGFGCGRDFVLPGGAHQPDEYIECQKLLEYTKTMALYAVDMLS